MSTANKRILIIVHDADMRFMLHKIFNDAGYSVESCAVGVGVIESRHAWPDLFILEKDLPTIDGIAISKFLRVQRATKKTPIIMLSAYRMEAAASRIGINEVMMKPFESSHLLEVAGKYINGPLFLNNSLIFYEH